jgi:hypothetical protein
MLPGNSSARRLTSSGSAITATPGRARSFSPFLRVAFADQNTIVDV